jgi:single-strand DNA-binding protein
MPHKNTNYAYQFIYQLIYQVFNFLKNKLVMSMQNQVHIIGHVGRAPEIKTTQNGKKNARFSVAAKEAFVNAEGKRVESTQWVSVVAWDGLATIAEKYVTKGHQIGVQGRLVIREYTDAKGERKWITEIVADEILLLGAKKQSAEAAA